MATKSKKKNAKKTTNAKETIQKTQVADSEKASVAKDAKKKETSKKDTKKPQKKKDKKPGFFTRIRDFVKGVFTELKKVNWLTKDELMKKSGFVAGFVAIFTVIVWIIDSGFGALAALLIGIK